MDELNYVNKTINCRGIIIFHQTVENCPAKEQYISHKFHSQLSIYPGMYYVLHVHVILPYMIVHPVMIYTSWKMNVINL